jgi:hypothetical protein
LGGGGRSGGQAPAVNGTAGELYGGGGAGAATGSAGLNGANGVVIVEEFY